MLTLTGVVKSAVVNDCSYLFVFWEILVLFVLVDNSISIRGSVQIKYF